MGAPSKRAKRVRVADEFDLGRLEAQLRLPRDGRTTIPAWSWNEIYDAREEQMLGQFVRPARMAEQMRTDDALAVAYENRLAPQRCIPVDIVPAQGARGESIADEAEALFGANGVGIHAETLADIHGDLVNHGVAFAVNVATPREDGSRVDMEMKYWPIEYVRWDPVFRVFKARADPNTVQPGDIPDSPYNEYGFVGGFWIPVVHGDGRWIIFKKHDLEPFRKEAALLPAALVWARHAFATRDWSKASKAHGSAKVIGELPSGVPLQAAGGGLSAEAAAFVDLLRAIASEDAPVGIRPAGSKTEYLTNNSSAWQVWSEIINNTEKAAARIYLGTDGTLGAQGGAPGVDIQTLFNVAATKVRGDLECIARSIDTGLIQPWCAINFGDSKLAPQRHYSVPNDDAQAVTDDYAKRNDAFYKALVDAKQAGLVLTPVYIAELAKDYRVRIPDLAQAPTAAPVPAKAGYLSPLVVGLDYNPEQPRDDHGRFGEGGEGGGSAEHRPSKPKPKRKRKTEVGLPKPRPKPKAAPKAAAPMPKPPAPEGHLPKPAEPHVPAPTEHHTEAPKPEHHTEAPKVEAAPMPKPPAAEGHLPKPAEPHVAAPKAAEPTGDAATKYFNKDPKKARRIREYTGSGYAQINKELTDGQVSGPAKALKADLASAPKAPGEVHRGGIMPASVADRMKPGEPMYAKSFWSTSRSEGIATKFASSRAPGAGEVKVIMHIQQKSGVDVSGLSVNKSEKETLIPYGTQFRVKNVVKRGGVQHVFLEEAA